MRFIITSLHLLIVIAQTGWHDVIEPDIVSSAQVIHSHSGFKDPSKWPAANSL
jgi:hypothetical protein